MDKCQAKRDFDYECRWLTPQQRIDALDKLNVHERDQNE